MTALQLKPRGRPIKGLPSTIDIDTITAEPRELIARLSKATKLSIHRLKLTYDSSDSPNTPIGLKDEKGPLSNYGLHDGSTVYIKDLGPQIGWQTVFHVEYLGPLLIHPLFLVPSLRPYLYPTIHPTSLTTAPLTPVQNTIFALIIIHFLKRQLETFFVHRFSSDTMPFANIFRNSAHYWLLAGILTAWPTYHPTSFTHNVSHSPLTTYITVAIWTLSQLLNLKTHLILSSLRPKGTARRGIPHGYGFDQVTSPNYGYESLSWLLVFWYSGWNWGVGVFVVFAVTVMYRWTVKKEKRYRREFGSAYRAKKNMMFPVVL